MVETRDGEKIYGSIFLALKDRLSDILNDDRRFLPVEIPDDTTEQDTEETQYKTFIIHKDIITKVHEI